MKKSTKLIITALICVAIFVGIYFLYGVLKENYTPNQFSDVTQNTSKVTDEYESEQVDTKAKDFKVFDENGNEVKLSDFFGKPIVLNFWATWCYYCREEMPDFNDAYHNNPDVQFLMVNVTDGRRETVFSAKQYVDDSDFDFTVLYDKNLDATTTYGAWGLPMTVFIDKDGNYVNHASGMLDAENLKRGIDLIK
ncbi:MAG: TlpA family protein disulfide reductase [Clostridia bacterium]|nr:TlpA family protein disulfide reductase [Clostridia bacterium]